MGTVLKTAEHIVMALMSSTLSTSANKYESEEELQEVMAASDSWISTLEINNTLTE